LLRRRWLDEEAEECDSCSASLKKEGKRGGRGGRFIGLGGVEQRGSVVAPRGEEVWARQGEGVLPDRRTAPAGSGPRPAGAGGVARPCRVAGSTGVREGVDRRARAHSAGLLRRLTGGPERTVPGGAAQTGFEIKSEFK
jgi:hypothetical protein